MATLANHHPAIRECDLRMALCSVGKVAESRWVSCPAWDMLLRSNFHFAIPAKSLYDPALIGGWPVTAARP